VRRNALKHGLSVAAIRDSGISGTIASGRCDKQAKAAGIERRIHRCHRRNGMRARACSRRTSCVVRVAGFLASDAGGGREQLEKLDRYVNAGHWLDVKWCSAISLVREPALQIFGPFDF
jgi:hypothetical protein